MKALSIRQPWAWLVVHGGKTIENRRWRAAYRGPFLIHASKGMTRDEYEGAVAFAKEVAPSVAVPEFGALPRGGFVGCARLVGVIDPHTPSPARLPVLQPGDRWAPRFPIDRSRCEHPWHMPTQFGFVLADIMPLAAFIEAGGALSFFNVPERIVDSYATIGGSP